MHELRHATLDEVRGAIAFHVIGRRAAERSLGSVRLHSHQRDGVDRLTKLLSEERGALLADDVGLGKTYVALAVARTAKTTLVIAPAALRDTWQTSARAANVAIAFVSVESLSRSTPQGIEPDLIIIDEAHHLRTPGTKRYSAATTLCACAPVLLLSATPIHNSRGDIRSVLALFLGTRAQSLSDAELARFVVRRKDTDVGEQSLLPRVVGPEWLGPVEDVDCLDRIMSLPPPVPPADGDVGGALLTYTLTRQWASSRAALGGALKRRLARARAMRDALSSGRLPTRAEITAWCFAEDTQQLAFPELIVAEQSASARELSVVVDQHCQAVRELLSWLAVSPDPDLGRAAVVRDVLARHPRARVVAFSEFAETISRLYELMSPTTRTAMITHGGGRVAGGLITRCEILERFAPGSGQREAERIDLLLSTDLLSEGVNLQTASVIVHLDLAWNPARLVQRVGRVRRIGSTDNEVFVYIMKPPAPTERLLRVEQRLQDKLRVAARSVGVAGVILPAFEVQDAPATQPTERIASVLTEWPSMDSPAPGCLIASAFCSLAAPVGLACVRFRGVVELLAVEESRVTDSATRILELLSTETYESCAVNDADARAMHALILHWLNQRTLSSVVDLSAVRIASSRRWMLQRVNAIARRAPRHQQPRLAPLVRAARGAACAALSAGAERVLGELARSHLPDEAWLQAIGEFASLNARDTSAPSEVLALLLLQPRER